MKQALANRDGGRASFDRLRTSVGPVGQSVPVVDAYERVTGQVGYVLNVELPGMLAGRILRSPHPHARVLRVDASRAERLPGVVAVLTRADLEHPEALTPRYGRMLCDQTIVAVDRVRFVGDPVAAVAAVDEEVADEALDLIEVDYEPLPAVFEVDEALRPDAPLLHEPRPEVQPGLGHLAGAVAGANNLCGHFKLRRGDVEQGFAQADFVFEDTFRSPAVQHVSLEPHVTVAQYEGGRLTLWSSTQMPHAIRAQMATMFHLPQSKVRVIVHTLGGGYGAKGSLRLEPIASLLAWKARRPVKIVLRRAEEFVTVTKHAATVHVKTGVMRDGTLVARQMATYFNTGAYADIGPLVARNGGLAMVGPYRVPHVKIDSYAVWTNLVPAGAFRGFGVPQAAWAYESQMDMIAERLGMDPLELRRRNVVHDGDRHPSGQELEDLHFDELIEGAVASVAWQPGDAWWLRQAAAGGQDESRSRQARPSGRQPREAAALKGGPGSAAEPGGQGGRETSKRRGKAVTVIMKSTLTPSTSTASAKLNEDGSLDVATSSVEMGQGATTALAQLAAEAAELPYQRVRVSEPDTDVTPYDQQTSSSRTTFSMGTAVAQAAREVKRQVLELAAGLLEVGVDDLVARNGRVEVRGAPERGLDYGEVVRKGRRGNLLGQGACVTKGGLDPETGQGFASVHWHQATAACEVEVDTETGKIEVLKFDSGAFAGRMVNPRLCELQTEGNTLFGLGQALFEEMRYEDGQVVNQNLADYMIPSFKDVPGDLVSSILERAERGEVHGIGETSLPPVMAAIANAVYNAVGVRITDLPLTAEKVLAVLSAES
ncbi:MAG: xanthine dehydrogenase family protein [Chloroflexi bacterium]|nr:xanthine dehydrogenase family protein [Chloroflexota bacterium]